MARYQFTYDSAGRLATVTDVSGNVTTVNHAGNGNPTSILSPYGQSTTLGVDSNGYLASVRDPSGATDSFTYGATGLMATLVDARSGLHQYTYDSLGRLTLDQDPAGGSKSLVRTELGSGNFSVAITSAPGVQSSYQTSTSSTGTFSRSNSLPGGLQASLSLSTGGTSTVVAADGTTLLEQFAAVVGSSVDPATVAEIPIRMVRAGMTFVDDVRSQSGALLVARGHEATDSLLERFRNFSAGTVREPVRVGVKRAKAGS